MLDESNSNNSLCWVAQSGLVVKGMDFYLENLDSIYVSKDMWSKIS